MMKICPVCKRQQAKQFLYRKAVPVHQNLIMKTESEAKLLTKGDLELYICPNCSFIFNAAFDESKLNYNSDYNNNANFSLVFDSYINKLVEYIVYEQNVCDSTIVEVGCGKGQFLNKIIGLGQGNIGYGFDPSYEGEESLYDNQLIFIKDFYNTKYANIQADVVICRHVIEHISDPVALLKTVRKALTNSVHAKVFFETPCAEWILRNKVIWDFFYEHCSYFTKHSLTKAFQLAGFEVHNVKHIFNGQYLWIEATVVAGESCVQEEEKSLVASTISLAEEFMREEDGLKHMWKTKIEELSLKEGKLAIWGAGAKGVTFANLLDPRCEFFSCVVDINPAKQGKYLPGTGHPIVNFLELKDRGISGVLLMNPNYKEEIKNILQNTLRLKVSILE